MKNKMDSKPPSNEERDKLLDTIKNNAEYEWPQDIVTTEYKCQDCGVIALRHFMPPCKHPYCNSCYQKYEKQCCKTCKEVIKEFTQDYDFDKKLLSLKIPCCFQNNGCQETIALGQFLEHYDKCNYSTEAISPQLWQPPSLEQRNLETIEKHSVKLDEITNEFKLMKQSYLQQDNTLKELTNEVNSLKSTSLDIQNTFSTLQVGLASLLSWKQSKDKFDTQLESTVKQNKDQIRGEISLIAQQLENSEQKLGVFSNQLQEVSANVEQQIKNNDSLRELTQLFQMTAASKDLVKSLVAQRSSTFIWKINNFKTTLEKLQRKNAPELESDIFITTEYGYQIRAKLLSDYTSGFTSFKIGFIKTDKPLPPIYYHRRTFIIVDQSSNREKADIEVVEEPGFGDGDAKRWMNGYLGPFNFPPITLIRKNDTYIKNDTIIIKILIEPLEALYKVFTNSTGVLVWKIENYTKRQQQEIDGVVQCLRSDYFYSSEGGYRMQTLLYLNGIRKENRSKHLSVCHCFQRGEWDDCLPPKFFHKTTCAILDPSDLQLRKRLLTKSKVANGTFWDCFDDFAALEDIANTTYMKNDTLVIEVTVESQ